MKKGLITILVLAVFVLTGFVQDQQNTGKQKPKATYQIGSAKVVVWENKNTDGTTWKNFRVEKVYRKGNEWKTTNSFNEDELLELKTAIDEAISKELVKVKSN